MPVNAVRASIVGAGRPGLSVSAGLVGLKTVRDERLQAAAEDVPQLAIQRVNRVGDVGHEIYSM